MASRHALVIGALWLAAAVAATSVGIVAVRMVGNQVGDPVSAPLTSTGVRQALSSVPATPAGSEEAPRPSHDPADDGSARTVTTDGGVVSARCSDARPTLLYATPADGYRTVRDSRQGAALVRFVGRTSQVTLTLTCQDDELTVERRTDRIGTVAPSTPAASPIPTAPASRAPEPSDHPDPSESAHDDAPGTVDTGHGTDD